MGHRIAVIPGDGIGQEVIAEGLRVLRFLDERHALGLSYEHFDLGAERYLRDGTTMPDDVMERFRTEFDAIYLGALGDPRVPSNVHAKDILLGSRFKLDLYINFRPVRLLDERYCPLKGKGPDDVDFVVFREHTEGPHTGIGGQFKRGPPNELHVEEETQPRRRWLSAGSARTPGAFTRAWRASSSAAPPTRWPSRRGSTPGRAWSASSAPPSPTRGPRSSSPSA